MGVRLVSTFTQYIGTSGDEKPTTDVQPGAQFLESDTGVAWKSDGTNWQRIPTDGAQTVVALGLLIASIQDMHRTLEQLRQGMIEKDTCADVSADNLAELVF